MKSVPRWTAAIGIVTLLAACSDQQPMAPNPQPSFTHVPSVTACDPAVATQIYGQIDALFGPGPQRSRARRLFGDVESACANQPVAGTKLMAYVKYTIQQKAQISATVGTVAQRFQALADNWDWVFAYVGYRSPSEAMPTGYHTQMGLALGTGGAAGVFRNDRLFTGDRFAGLESFTPYVGTPSERLWLIVPIECPTHLGVTGLCFDFSVHPHDEVNSQAVIAALCPLNGTPAHDRVLLAHEDLEDQQGVRTKIPRKASLAGFNLNCHDAPTIGFGSSEELWQYATDAPNVFERASSAVVRFFAPTPAFAIHGGLGGHTDTRTSSFYGTPYGVEDPLRLSDDFQNDVIGQPPASPDIGYTLEGNPTPEPWVIALGNPSSATVQASLGDIASKLLVVDQKGGASGNSAPLTAYALVIGTPPNKGRVSVRWRSVISTPTVVSAPIVIREFNFPGQPAGAEVARIEYRSGSSAKSGPIALNGVNVPGVTWNQNVSQYFEVIANLDSGTLEIKIRTQGWSETASANATGSFTAANVGRFGIELTGQDNQIMGIDDVSISRIPDAQ